MTILVVDDSLIVKKKMQTILEFLGHKVITANSGREAIEIYKSANPDLVTMDIIMPSMDGLTSLKIIKKIDNNAKIIMITSGGYLNLIMESMQKGALDYILKPITEEKLKNAIDKVFIKNEENL